MKVKRFGTGVGLAFLSLSYNVMAGSVIDAKITKLQMGKSPADVLFIQLDRTKDSLPVNGCHINGAWTYVMSMTTEHDKKIYALLLAARVSQQPVTITGTNNCDVFGSIESLGVAAL